MDVLIDGLVFVIDEELIVFYELNVVVYILLEIKCISYVVLIFVMLLDIIEIDEVMF